MYFLLVKAIASLMLILYAMILSTVYYMLVFICYTIVAGALFTTVL